MRKFLFMLTLLSMPFLVSAQKTNSRGEKMVVKIETFGCNFRTGEMRKGAVFTFKYDSNNRIVSLTKTNGKEKQVITKVDKTFDRKFYYDKNSVEKSIKYEYLLDESGNIIQKNYYEGIGDPLTTKEVWNFLYRYDEFSGRCIVDSVSYGYMHRDIQAGMRDYELSDGETEFYTLKVKRGSEGLYYTSSQGSAIKPHDIRTEIEYTVGLVDDTNLNLNYLWGDAPCTIAGDCNGPLEFLVPEWVNCKSGYLYSRDSNCEYVQTKDKNGNIVKIEQYRKYNGKLKEVFVITYR